MLMSEEEKDDFMVVAKELEKTYEVGNGKVEVLKDISLEVSKGEFVVLCGPSGSGKTTLLNNISGIDRPTKGQIFITDQELTDKDEDFISDFRCKHIGFIFQSYNLVSKLTVAENVAFPMEWLRKPSQEVEKRVNELIQTVGLEHRKNHFPLQLSGGEQQRVAFSRALAMIQS